MKTQRILIIAGAIALGGFLVWRIAGPGSSAEARDHIVDVTMPASLSQRAVEGEELFSQYCATCHGDNAAGTDSGPPLIHRIYESGHHGDQSFLMAAMYGVRAHHWKFGDMPPVEGITEAEVADIVTYVREVQRANGIR
ncbi:c-type cytochrome [Jiella marina]|uniref:c-type cytochrome n=1 Tax=Jiella sp. LLJ827 TaxID=2917712 RepID=UPI002101B172|nr:cytochrome c [Jiella sp. LLJ827]MCQ0989083.1 cytochrome c [Jiella sp. LLJ827]